MSWKYDGDGQRVKAFLSGSPSSTTTYYIGNHTEYEIVGQTTTLRRYFYAGSTRVAMRVVDGATNPTYWLLNDRLTSTAITADSTGARFAELRYKAWGETRFTYGSTPTTYRYTGQKELSQLSIYFYYFYCSRYYDPSLSRFIQPDTIVPNPGDPRAWDRFAYVLNNPLKYIDPSGHRNCEEDGYNCRPGDTGGGTSDTGSNGSGNNDTIPVVVLPNNEQATLFFPQLPTMPDRTWENIPDTPHIGEPCDLGPYLGGQCKGGGSPNVFYAGGLYADEETKQHQFNGVVLNYNARYNIDYCQNGVQITIYEEYDYPKNMPVPVKPWGGTMLNVATVDETWHEISLGEFDDFPGHRVTTFTFYGERNRPTYLEISVIWSLSETWHMTDISNSYRFRNQP